MTPTSSQDDLTFAMNRRIGRGVNLGNALEAPKEGAWGVTLQAEYFRLIKEQGFQSVRVPVRWSAHADDKPPYTIDAQFFERVDWVIEQARLNGLVVILNIHHYNEANADPAGHRARVLAIWAQIAVRYKDVPDWLLFELFNEPNGKAMPPEVWNALARDLLAKIRETNPERYIVVGPVDWNSVYQLNVLELPAGDRRIIGTFHYYLPFPFTHQGAEWAQGSEKWLGTLWQATAEEKAAVDSDLDLAQAWSAREHRPVLLGEFGAYSKAEMSSRARWTAYVARAAEERGMSWSYWEFCAGFGVYDPHLRVFRQPLLQALIPPG